MDRAGITRKQRCEIADRLAKERLEYVNEHCETVNISKHKFYIRYVKRMIDIVISLIALIVTLPINLLIGIITYFDVGNPIFFQQVRTGRNGISFRLVKFRNMRNIKDANGDLLHASQRVTKFGTFVRGPPFDELLNVWSILKGEKR